MMMSLLKVKRSILFISVLFTFTVVSAQKREHYEFYKDFPVYADKLLADMKAKNLRASIDDSADKLGAKIRRAETASCCSVQTSDRLAARLRGKEVFVHRGAHPGAITLPSAERGGDDVEGVSPSTRRGHKAGEWESDQARSSKGTASRSAGEDKRAWPSRARPRWTLQT